MWTENERLRWRLIAVVITADACLLATGRMSIGADYLLVPLIAGVIAALSYFYRTSRPDERIALCCSVVAQMVLFTNAIILLNYLVTEFNRPIIDATLMQWDKALGFDWRQSYLFALHNKWAGDVLSITYSSSQVQLVLASLVLAAALQKNHLDRFLLAFMIAAITTIGFWALFPSFGVPTYLVANKATAGLPDLTIQYGYIKPQLALLAGEIDELRLFEMTGIVAFPSFHTAMALLTVYASSVSRVLFWPVAAWNLVVILSVPPCGGHYIVDVIGGIVVAWGAVTLAERLVEAQSESAGTAAEQRAGPPVLGAA